MRNFHTPFNGAGIRYLVRKLTAAFSEQKTAATLATSLMNRGVVTHPGKIEEILLTTGPAACDASESMVFDVLKNGSSILTATYTYDSTVTPGQHSLMSLLDPTKAVLAVGDKLEVSRTYTAGGTPTPMTHTRVDVEWAPAQD